MQLALDRTDLLRALGRVRDAVRASDNPILSGVLLTASAAGQLSITGTDLSVQVTSTLPADVAEPGSLVVPAATLWEVARRLPDLARVQASTPKEGSLLLRAGRSRLTLPCLPPEDFPAFPIVEGTQYRLPPADLARLLDVAHAAARDDPRVYLRGAHLSAAGGVLRMVATDGHRLSQVDAPLPQGAEGALAVTVPAATLALLRRLVEGETEDAVVAVSSTLIQVQMSSTTLVSKLVDGPFPDVTRVIPLANEGVFEVRRADLAAAVARVRAVAGERGHLVRVRVEQDKLVLSVVDDGTGGSAEEDLDAEYGGDPIDVGLNSRYLTEALDHAGGEVVVVSVGGSRDPVLLAGKDDERALQVLMPMRLP